MARILDNITGEIFKNLKVFAQAPRRSGHGSTYWSVECQVCGRQKQMQRGPLFRLLEPGHKGTGCKYCNHRERKKLELIGKRIDRLTVVEFLHADEHGKLVWKVRCDCGEVSTQVTSTLRRREKSGRMACGSCLRQMDDEDLFWSTRISEMRSNAKTRKLDWALDDERTRTIMEQACRYCGSPPAERSRVRQRKRKSTVTGWAGSIDRVDSELGYVERNCVPSCDLCNQMKSDLSVDDFLELCERIHANQRLEESA